MENGVALLAETTIPRLLIYIINILVLVIPVIALLLLAFFLPWYFKKRTHLISKKLELEEEQINFQEDELIKK